MKKTLIIIFFIVCFVLTYPFIKKEKQIDDNVYDSMKMTFENNREEIIKINDTINNSDQIFLAKRKIKNDSILITIAIMDDKGDDIFGTFPYYDTRFEEKFNKFISEYSTGYSITNKANLIKNIVSVRNFLLVTQFGMILKDPRLKDQTSFSTEYMMYNNHGEESDKGIIFISSDNVRDLSKRYTVYRKLEKNWYVFQTFG
jgi:hypothetical protein